MRRLARENQFFMLRLGARFGTKIYTHRPEGGGPFVLREGIMLETLENIVFRSRLIILGFFAAFTIYSGYYATQQNMTAGFEKAAADGP
jgi:hypothetical protein